MNSQMTLDETRLAELEDDFGVEDLACVVEAFLEEAAEAVASLEAMVSDSPDQARTAQFHFLVGSARNLGATGLADLCGVHELADSGFDAEAFGAVKIAFAEARRGLEGRVGLS